MYSMMKNFQKTRLDGERIRMYIPPSPRNRIMYFMDTDKEGELFQLVKHILKGDQANEIHGHTMEIEPPPVPRKKRKHSSCLVSVSQCAVLGQILALNSTVLTQITPFTSCLKKNLSLKVLSSGDYMSKVEMSAS